MAAQNNNYASEIIGNKYVWTHTSGMKGKVAFTESKADWEALEGSNKGKKGLMTILQK